MVDIRYQSQRTAIDVWIFFPSFFFQFSLIVPFLYTYYIYCTISYCKPTFICVCWNFARFTRTSLELTYPAANKSILINVFCNKFYCKRLGLVKPIITDKLQNKVVGNKSWICSQYYFQYMIIWGYFEHCFQYYQAL